MRLERIWQAAEVVFNELSIILVGYQPSFAMDFAASLT
jgi:hypothetical protein